MSLSEEEKVLIEAHIKARGVIVCPPSTFTPMHEIRYRDRNRNVKPNPRLEERNRMIDRLHAEGLSQAAIAKALDINPAAVSYRVQWITYKASLPKKDA